MYAVYIQHALHLDLNVGSQTISKACFAASLPSQSFVEQLLKKIKMIRALPATLDVDSAQVSVQMPTPQRMPQELGYTQQAVVAVPPTIK